LAALDAGLLCAFITGFHLGESDGWVKWLPGRLRDQLAKRSFPELQQRVLGVTPMRELARLACQRLGWLKLVDGEDAAFSVDRLYRAVDRKAADWIRNCDFQTHLHLYEDGALEALRACSSLGRSVTYELPIGYWRTHQRICQEERALRPEWCEGWNANIISSAKADRKDEELANSPHIVVPSDFVAESLKEFPGRINRMDQIPYGCPPVWGGPFPEKDRRVLKVLYVGGLSQRKGLSYFCEAISGLENEVSVSMVGLGPLAEKISKCCPEIKLLGALAHHEVLSVMRAHDVLVFPSLFEGMALVVEEALSQGLPVITTVNSGTGILGIEKHGAGWVVPIRTSEPIREILLSLLKDVDLRVSRREGALNLASSQQWSHYREKLLTVWKGYVL